LAAMDTPDTVTANWLRTAFERIVDRTRDKSIDPTPLMKFAEDRNRQGRARRFALDIAEMLQPGCRLLLLGQRNAIEDPEFRYDAIDLEMEKPATKVATGEAAKRLYRRLFDASR